MACSASGRPPWAASAAHFYWLTLALVVAGGRGLCARSSSRPLAMRCAPARDSPLRGDAIGIDRESACSGAAFVIAGAGAGSRARCSRSLKGSVFPETMGVSTLDRRAGDGAARRRRDPLGPDRRRDRLQAAFDLARSATPTTSQARARPRHHRPGASLSQGHRRLDPLGRAPAGSRPRARRPRHERAARSAWPCQSLWRRAGGARRLVQRLPRARCSR